MEHYSFQMTGTAHRSMGIPLEDALYLGFVSAGEHNVFAISLADGMGSTEFGRAGAITAAHESFKIVRRTSPGSSSSYGARLALEASTVAAFSSAANEVAGRARFLGRPALDLGTTLMVVQYDEKAQQLYYACCGDGGIVVLSNSNEAYLVEKPQVGKGNSTSSVTMPEWWRSGVVGGVKAFLLCTDGLLDSFMDRGELTDLAQRVFAMGPSCKDDLDALFGDEGTDEEALEPTSYVSDDRSIVVCWSDSALGLDEAEADPDVDPDPGLPQQESN